MRGHGNTSAALISIAMRLVLGLFIAFSFPVMVLGLSAMTLQGPETPAADPDLAEIEKKLATTPTPSAQTLEDFAQRLDDVILDTTYSGGLDKVKKLLDRPDLKSRLATNKRGEKLAKILAIRQKVAEMERMKIKEEEAKKKSEEAKKKADETKSKLEEAAKTSEEAKKKAEETTKKSEEAKTKAGEAKTKAEEAKKKADVAKKAEETKKAEDAKNKEDVARKEEEDARKEQEKAKNEEQEAKKKAEDAKKEDEEAKTKLEAALSEAAKASPTDVRDRLELELMEQIFDVFLSSKSGPSVEAASDFLKFKPFLETRISPVVNKASLKSNFTSSLRLLSREADEWMKSDPSLMPSEKPIPFTVENLATEKATLYGAPAFTRNSQLETRPTVLYKIGPRESRTFRYLKNFYFYNPAPKAKAKAGKVATENDWRPIPITTPIRVRFKFEAIGNDQPFWQFNASALTKEPQAGRGQEEGRGAQGSERVVLVPSSRLEAILPMLIGLYWPDPKADATDDDIKTILKIDSERPPKGLKGEDVQVWKDVAARLIKQPKLHNPLYEKYKNRAAKSPNPASPDVEFDDVLELLDDTNGLLTLENASATSKEEPEADDLNGFAKLIDFTDYLLEESDRLKPPTPSEEDKKKINSLREYRLVRDTADRSLSAAISYKRRGGSGVSPPVEPMAEVSLTLKNQVDELSRARTQFYSAWRPNASKSVYSCLFRYRPDGTDDERVATCRFYPEDPKYVYYFHDTAPCTACVNGQWVTYGSSSICWGRLDLTANTFGGSGWQWVPNRSRTVMPVGYRPTSEAFGESVPLPAVPFSLNQEQFMLWPSKIGLPGGTASTYASSAPVAAPSPMPSSSSMVAPAPPAPSFEAPAPPMN